ncbi:MAG: hypothetical protein H0X38_04195 [Planctomycetes bacterium]|nr:hypothetical protein [Planctomycetota bacterium]
MPAGTVPPANVAAATEPAHGAPKPALLTVESGGGVFSLRESESSELSDGVDIGYAGALLRNDRIRHWQSTPTGLTRAILDHALLLAGPKGKDPAHVIIDTRQCELPELGFRGLLTPEGVEVQRVDIVMLPPVAVGGAPKPPGVSTAEPITDPKPRPATPAPTEGGTTATVATGDEHPAKAGKAAPLPPIALVHYRILLHHLEGFQGKLRSASGWKDHMGWADEAELLMVADLLPTGLANPRFETIHLFGRQARGDLPKRPAQLVRLREGVHPPAALGKIAPDELDMSIESMTQTIEFDAAGQVKRMLQGQDVVIKGTPSLDMPVGRSSQPKLEPAPAKP